MADRDITAVLQIPTQANPNYQQRTKLDGREYILRFAWNQREECWYLTIADSANEVLVPVLKLVANWPLLRWYQHDERVPPGELMVTDLTADGSPPGFEELGIGRRAELTYFAVTDQ